MLDLILCLCQACGNKLFASAGGKGSSNTTSSGSSGAAAADPSPSVPGLSKNVLNVPSGGLY